MIDYLRSTSDRVQKADVVKRLGELAERFAPDTQWFIETMNQVKLSFHTGNTIAMLFKTHSFLGDIGLLGVKVRLSWY